MRAIRAVAALALVTAGCSSERESGGGAAATTIAGSAAAPETSALAPDETATSVSGETTTGDSVAGSVPAGAQQLEIAELGVRFAVPETYTPLVPTELGPDFYDSESFTELAERVQLEPDVFAQSLREELSLFVFAPAQAEGYVDNVRVSVLPDESLPDENEIAESLEPLDVTEFDYDVTASDTDSPEVVRAAYARPGTDALLFARDLTFESTGGLVSIAVVAGTAEEADAVAGIILGTLEVDET